MIWTDFSKSTNWKKNKAKQNFTQVEIDNLTMPILLNSWSKVEFTTKGITSMLKTFWKKFWIRMFSWVISTKFYKISSRKKDEKTPRVIFMRPSFHGHQNQRQQHQNGKTKDSHEHSCKTNKYALWLWMQKSLAKY